MALTEFVRDLPQAPLSQAVGYADPGYTGPRERRLASRLGPIIVDAEKIIASPRGIFGFETLRQLVLLRLPAVRFGPLGLLQCVEDPSAAFLFYADVPSASLYRPGDLDAACRELAIDLDAVAALVLVTARSAPAGITMNLRAPVIVDTVRRTACQHILSRTDYPVRFKP
jgi:flagellar assembly factor FliW